MPALEFGWCGRLLPAHLDARESLYDQVHGERRRQVIYLAFAVVMEREPFERAARLSDDSDLHNPSSKGGSACQLGGQQFDASRK